MAIFKIRSRSSRKGLSFTRVISAVLVLGILVLIIAESAKYLNEAKVPKTVSLKVREISDKVAYVSSFKDKLMGGLADLEGSIVGRDREKYSENTEILAVGEIKDIKPDGVPDDDKTAYKTNSDRAVQSREAKPDVAGAYDSRSMDSVGSFEASKADIVLRAAVLSDAHNDLEYLHKALDKATKLGADIVVFLGDYTDWGEIDRLLAAKDVMDSSGLKYFSLPGDHDLGQTRDESNFVKVFGDTYGTYETDGTKFVYFDNSKNYTKIGHRAMSWFQKEIQDAEFLFLSQPLVTSSMSRVMGIINGVKDLEVFGQNTELINTVRSGKVRVIMSGDLHQFSQFKDPVKPDLWHYSVGAVLKTQSLEKINLQSPRFCVLEVKADKSYKVTDVPID